MEKGRVRHLQEQTCHNPLLPLAVFTGHESTLHAAEGWHLPKMQDVHVPPWTSEAMPHDVQ